MLLANGCQEPRWARKRPPHLFPWRRDRHTIELCDRSFFSSQEAAMCLHPQAIYLIPEQTAQIAHAILPDGNLCLRLYDELGTIYSDSLFADLFPRQGQPATSPTRLALVLVLQFLENLTDRQAAAAVRLRIDWKYLLGLELTDRGFHYSVLSEFRDRLLAHDPAALLLASLLDRLQDRGLYRPRGRQRTDSTHILAAIHTLNRLELVGRTLQQALNALA